MPGPYKVVLGFTNRKQGWQEVYYAQAADPTTAEGMAVGLATQRNQLLAPPATLDTYKVGDETTPRSGFLVPWGTNPPSTWESDADEPDVCMMMRLYSSGDLRSRPVFLRGNPDNVFDTINPSNADRQAWLTKFTNFGQFLKNIGSNALGTWLIKKRPRPGVGSSLRITAWAPSTISANTDITVDGVITFGPKPALQVYGVRGLPEAPGLVKVVSFVVAAGNTAVVVRYRTPSDYSYSGAGTVVLYAPTYDPITSWASTPRSTRRITGRPLGLTRGRRRSIPR